MLALPNELLLCILCHLDVWSLCNASMACRRLRTAPENPMICRSVTVVGNPGPAASLSIVLRHGECIHMWVSGYSDDVALQQVLRTSATLRSNSITESPLPLSDGLCRVIAGLSLKHLRLDGTNVESLRPLRNLSEHLESLSARKCAHPSGQDGSICSRSTGRLS